MKLSLVNLQVLEVLDLRLIRTAAVCLYRVMENHTFSNETLKFSKLLR